jgi:hypothetical protein
MMSQHLDLKALERKAWAPYVQDGLWDLFFGLLLVSTAVSSWFAYIGAPPATRIPAYMSIVVLAGVVLWAGKRFVTTPRMGRVKYGPARKARLHALRIIVFAAVFATGALFVAALGMNNGWLARPAWMTLGRIPSGSIIAVIIILAVFSMMAAYMDFKRLYLYGVLFALQEAVGVGLQAYAGIDSGFFIGAVVAAAIVMVIGTVVFSASCATTRQ